MSAALDTSPLLSAEELDVLIGHVTQGVSPPRDAPFFEQLVTGLARALAADFVSVGEVVGPKGSQIRTLAVFSDGAITSNMVYDLEGTPCAEILVAGVCVYPCDVDRLFPRDTWLAENGMRAYAGAILQDAEGAPLGVLTIMSRQPITRVRLSSQLAQIFGERAAVELERQRRERKLELHSQSLLLLNELTDHLHRSLNRSRLAYQALNILLHHGLADGALLYLHDPGSEQLELSAWAGVNDEHIGDLHAPVTLTHHLGDWDSGAAWTLESCPTPQQTALRNTLEHLDARDAAVIPLSFMGRRLGAVELLYHAPREFGTVELDTLRAVGRTLSLALVNADQFTEIEYQALHDPLTGLPNRKRFHRDARQQLAGDRPMALLLLDLNRFGEINNTLGHHTGDRLLREVGARLRQRLDEHILLARLSADEFAILLPGSGEMAPAADSPWLQETVRDILTALDQPFHLDDLGLEVNASLGIALAPTHGRDSHALLRCADVALQRVKQGGSDLPALVYQRDFDQQNPLRLAMMTDLTTAIRQDQLSLCFQPKIHLGDRSLSGLEALVRWEHPELGHIPPGQFIPLVEKTELIRPLTFWVLDKALQYLRNWRRLGLEVPVAVNLSARVLTDPTLPEYLASMLRRHEVPARFLELEITESALMADPQKALEIARQIATLGVKLSIDDFGTGYSSLAYLKRLPLTALKIDRSFVAEMFDSENDAIIVRSTIGLAHSLGLRVVAEGIEDDNTLETLREMGCDEGQGFGIGRPEPASAVQARLTRSGDSDA